MSPSTLAECWKVAEQSSMRLREQTIDLLKSRGVRRNCLITAGTNTNRGGLPPGAFTDAKDRCVHTP